MTPDPRAARCPRAPAAGAPGRVPLGISAESRAAAYLIAKGFRIIARRFRTPVGEIDIVARRRKLLVFVEVKARERLDDAAWSVTDRQRARIVAAAEAWLASNPDDVEQDIRFDAVLVAPGKHAAAHPGGVRRERLRTPSRNIRLRRVQLVERTVHLPAARAPRPCRDRLRQPRPQRARLRSASLRRRRRVLAPAAISSARSRCGCAAVSALRAISWVAAPCSVTAAAIAAVISPISRMVCSMPPIASIERMVACCMPAICGLMSPVALAVWPASALTSLRHHRKAAAGFARARGLDGGIERQQIGLLGNAVISRTTSPMRAGGGVEFIDPACVRSASPTALVAIAFDCATCRSISATDAVQFVRRRRDVAHVAGASDALPRRPSVHEA